MTRFLTSAWLHAFGIAFAVLFFDRLPNALRWPVRIYCYLAVAWIVFRVARLIIGAWKGGRRRLAFGVAGAAMFYLVFEGVCFAFNKVATAGDLNYKAKDALDVSDQHRKVLKAFLKGRSSFYAFDPVTGWTIKPEGNFHDTYLANGQGLRADREYAKEVPDGISRIVCTGDSYTFGVEVGNADAWPAVLDREAEDCEVLNFGVPGTCLTQSYLRYERLKDNFDHQTVVIGFMSNNIQRTVNAFRPFLQSSSGFPFVKPFSRLDANGQLEVVACPFRSVDDYRDLLERPAEILGDLARMEFHFKGRSVEDRPFPPSVQTWRVLSDKLPVETNVRQIMNGGSARRLRRRDAYEPDDDRFKIVSRLFDTYVGLIESEGRRAVILIYPHDGDIADHNRKRDPEYRSMVDHLRKSGHQCLDFLDYLGEKYGKRIPSDRVFLKTHYNPETNADVAAFVRRELARKQAN